MVTVAHNRLPIYTLDSGPLEKGSARRRNFYLTRNNNHYRQTTMPTAGFEPVIPARERPQTHALDRKGTGIRTESYA